MSYYQEPKSTETYQPAGESFQKYLRNISL